MEVVTIAAVVAVFLSVSVLAFGIGYAIGSAWRFLEEATSLKR